MITNGKIAFKGERSSQRLENLKNSRIFCGKTHKFQETRALV